KKEGGTARRPNAACGKVGAVDRPAPAVRIVDVEHRDLALIELVLGQHAIFVVGLEEDDGSHQCAGEVPGVLLGEFEVVRHLRAPSLERAIPARWLLKGLAPGAITAQAKTSGRSLLADPSWVDRGRSGAGPGRHHKRAELDRGWGG